MRQVHLDEMATLAKASKTPLGALVRAALADSELKLPAALRTRLEKAGYTIAASQPKGREMRHVCSVTVPVKTGEGDQATTVDALVAWATSDSPEYALTYSMLGAMREGK